MSARAKGAARAKATGKAAAGRRTRVAGAPRLQPRRRQRDTLLAMPAAPVAAFGLGELLIRAWAARQHAA